VNPADTEGTHMARQNEETKEVRDGRPAEIREGQQPQSRPEAEEDIPDPETVESVGY
jgi:hypothetical protein